MHRRGRTTTEVKIIIVALYVLLLLRALLNQGFKEILNTNEFDLIIQDAPSLHFPPHGNNGFCRELIEGAELIMNSNEKSALKIQMIQLVGKYTGKYSFLGDTMEQNFLHNARMLQPHNIKATPIRAPVEDIPDTLSPAFWKMDAIKHHCTRNNYDLVFFLDGDACIMDPYARVEFIWSFHTELARARDGIDSIDMLFSGDRSELNSGVFVVNCTSRTAIKTLTIWRDVALMLARNETAIVHEKWYEQNALHLMMRTQKWADYGSLRWNDIISKYTLELEAFSTESLRKRIRQTTQCALNTYVGEIFSKRNNSERFVYKPGHFILHMAGVSAKQKRVLMNRYRNTTKPSTKQLSLQEAARLYLKNHRFSFDRTLPYEKWKMLLDWNHKWPEA